MDQADRPATGTISWIDLTVPDALKIRDFYSRVTGWTSTPVSMGDYSDFGMNVPSTGTAVGGVCHARGENAALPAVWMIYIQVANLDQSIQQCNELGGKVIAGPNKSMGGQFVVIQDPAGAVAALYEAAK